MLFRSIGYLMFITKLIYSSEPEKKNDENAPIEWEWKITTPPPRIKYIDINEESFFSALMEVING